MDTEQQYTLVFTTFETVEQAQRVARILIEENLVACCTLLPGAQSFYRWEGAIEQSTEVQALLKTSQQLFEQLSVRLCQLHSYQVPECIAVPVSALSPSYKDWLNSVLRGAQN